MFEVWRSASTLITYFQNGRSHAMFPPNKEHVLWKEFLSHPLDMQMILSNHFPKKIRWLLKYEWTHIRKCLNVIPLCLDIYTHIKAVTTSDFHYTIIMAKKITIMVFSWYEYKIWKIIMMLSVRFILNFVDCVFCFFC